MFFFLDSLNFDELLDLCVKWKLVSYKIHIENYFFNHHKHGLHKYDGELNLKSLKLLKLADKYKLINYYNAFLKETKVCLELFLYSDTVIMKDFRNSLKNSSPRLRYEVLKIAFLAFNNANKNHNQNSIEIFVIFNFLELILYENRVPDLSVTKPKSQSDDGEGKIQTHIDMTKDVGGDSKVVVEVDGHEVLINSITLTENSPVFNAMLNSSFKEGQEKIIKLPGKKINDVLEFFSFLKKPREISCE